MEWATIEKLSKGDKRFEGKVKRYKNKLSTQGVFANVCTINIHNYTHGDMLSFQIDNEFFNPEYTEVDRVLDVAVQTEATGEVGRVQVMCLMIYWLYLHSLWFIIW